MRRDREGEKGREREGEREKDRERERQRLLALQRSDDASAGQMSFIPRATEQLDGVQQRIRALEDMLSNTREALQQGREALTYRDAELKRVRGECVCACMRASVCAQVQASACLCMCCCS